MTVAQKPKRTIAQVERWLASRHAGAISDLTALAGGFWSSAYSYAIGEDEFVVRISDMREGFEIDTAAMKFAAPALPVPTVVETGSALGAYFAISRRHHGRFIEIAPVEEAEGVGVALETLLAALRAVPAAPAEPVVWYDANASAGVTWHDWLLSGLVDDPSERVSGWRAKLAADPALDALFERCEGAIRELLPSCPERRDLVHSDLLHQNVLVDDDDAARVTAVFSWKCSVRGDFLFDVAWCTFWGDWLPVIGAPDMWRRTVAAPDLDATDLIDAGLRHHCYELQIAASHLGWNAWTGDDRVLAEVAAAAERLLERGPLSA
jgi:aminoglycoside phosphotransferase (APT) family kinase protein